MFKQHVICRYGLVVKPLQYYFGSRGCVAKIMAGNYILGFCIWGGRTIERVFDKPHSPDIEGTKAQILAGALHPVFFTRSGGMDWPVAVGYVIVSKS